MLNIKNMSAEEFIQKETMPLTTEIQIRAYVHPLRMQILDKITRVQMTVSQTAKEFGVHPANLTHHFRMLEKSGLIVLVEKRDTGRNLEKYYRSAAKVFIVSPLKKMSGKKSAALALLREDLTSAISRSDDTDGKILLAFLESLKLDGRQVSSLKKELKKLISAYARMNPDKGQVYNLNISLYPSETETLPNREIIIEE